MKFCALLVVGEGLIAELLFVVVPALEEVALATPGMNIIVLVVAKVDNRIAILGLINFPILSCLYLNSQR